jgi:predicted nucleotidyltransferase
MNAAARAYLEHRAARPEARAVILFGSQAHGDRRLDSDVDLLLLCHLDFVAPSTSATGGRSSSCC